MCHTDIGTHGFINGCEAIAAGVGCMIAVMSGLWSCEYSSAYVFFVIQINAV
jgi:hypothetical protein